MLRTILLVLAFAAIVMPRPVVAAIPEPPPYPWEYHARGTVAFIPYVTHSGLVLSPEQLQPGW